MIRGCVVVFLSIQLFEQVQIVNTFTETCNASLQTVTRVTMCPSNISAYEEAVQKKNCSSLAADAHACKSFQYHCVLSDDLKDAIEVCAPSIYIVGYSCTKFSTSHKSIMRIEGFACNDSFTECPFGYNSTKAYIYSLCYENVSRPLSTEIPPNVTKPLLTEIHPRIENSKTLEPWLIVLVISIFLGTGSFFICLCVFTYKRRTRRRADPILHPEAIELEIRADPILHPEAIELEIREQVLLEENQDDIDGDHDNGEARSLLEDIHNQLNGDISLIYERTSEQIQPEVQNTTNNDTGYQASLKTTISATSEMKQIMLECAVSFLFRNLENPDESWTKEKIICHVEKTIQRLINSNAHQLLISFIKRLDSDKKITATILKCGEEMYALISSFQEKYVANKLKITDGCVCVTFCFSDASDLENYLEKVQKKDKHLITDLSKILINETLLRIFDINSKVATWKASELKVYEGSHLVKTEIFLEPLTDSPKDFTGISEESSEESEDEKKCNMFRSKETSKYPGYMKYRTRAKSFDDCKVDWLKDKKEEFAKYGFLYQGVDCKTNCFHCGCFKDNWTEKDDIFATHVFFRKSCAYVQYLNTHLIKEE